MLSRCLHPATRYDSASLSSLPLSLTDVAPHLSHNGCLYDLKLDDFTNSLIVHLHLSFARVLSNCLVFQPSVRPSFLIDGLRVPRPDSNRGSGGKPFDDARSRMNVRILTRSCSSSPTLRCSRGALFDITVGMLRHSIMDLTRHHIRIPVILFIAGLTLLLSVKTVHSNAIFPNLIL